MNDATHFKLKTLTKRDEGGNDLSKRYDITELPYLQLDKKLNVERAQRKGKYRGVDRRSSEGGTLVLRA